jgi:hypothetical protein
MKQSGKYGLLLVKIVILPLNLYWCDAGVSDQSLVLCAFNVETQKDSQGTVASRQSLMDRSVEWQCQCTMNSGSRRQTMEMIDLETSS